MVSKSSSSDRILTILCLEFLRSVAHQSRLTKIAELLAQGEIDGCKSIVEQPGGPVQTVLAELASKHDPTNDQLEVYPSFLLKFT